MKRGSFPLTQDIHSSSFTPPQAAFREPSSCCKPQRRPGSHQRSLLSVNFDTRRRLKTEPERRAAQINQRLGYSVVAKMSGQATRAAVIGWTALALLTCVHGGHMLDLLRAATPTNPLGHPDPPPVPRVRCWCSSYPNATVCSWPEPSHSPPTHYVATCRERHRESVIKSCHLVQPGSSPSSERLWSCHLPNLRLLTDHVINVTAIYSNRSSSYLSSFMLEDILKPDPPVDVHVSLKAKTLQVRWSPPPTWANMDIFPLKYHIRYQWTTRGILKSVSLGPFESTTAHLKGLVPGRSYLFQVCAKELLGLGECSHWSSAVRITLPRNNV